MFLRLIDRHHVLSFTFIICSFLTKFSFPVTILRNYNAHVENNVIHITMTNKQLSFTEPFWTVTQLKGSDGGDFSILMERLGTKFLFLPVCYSLE